MTRMMMVVVYLVVACGGGGSREDESKARADQCAKMRDHLVELRLATAPHIERDVEQHRAALAQAMGPAFIEGCTKDMTEAEVACVIGAKDAPAAAVPAEPKGR